MLGKLLKHEFIATGRMYIPVYLCLLVFTPLLGFIIRAVKEIDNTALSAFSGLSMTGYVLLLVATAAAAFVFIIIRFYKSMTTDEAYLTFTIPANTSTIISSKLIPAIIWAILSTILFIFSIGLFTFILELWNFSDLKNLFNGLFLNFPYDEYRTSFSWFIFITIIMLIVSTISGILQIYASISLGQLMKTHRLLASIGFYIALYVVMQIVSTIAIIPIMINMDMTSSTQNHLVNNSESSFFYIIDFINLTFILTIIVGIITGIAFYVTSVYCFKKKLNLE